MNQTMRWKKGDTSNRLLALDAVRGLAVIGMFIQHFGLQPWNAFVSGNTMILFILCSGISYSLMAGSMLERGTELSVFRARILARSVFIDFTGYLILMLNGPFGVVLQAYAMLFLMALALVKRSTVFLAAFSAVSFWVCPPLMLIGLSLFEGTTLLSDIAGGPLSGMAWLPVFTAGMAIGRLELGRTKTIIRLIGTGAAILVPVKAFSVFILPDIYDAVCSWLAQFPASAAMPDPYAVWPRNTTAPLWHMLFLDAPQGGSAFELLIGTGGSMLLLGAVLLLEKRFPCILSPFAKTGRVALTLYSLQFVFAWFLMLLDRDPTSLAQSAAGDLAIVLVTLMAGWILCCRKTGPLETAIRRFERKFYQADGRMG